MHIENRRTRSTLRPSGRRGFTLIELLIIIAIIAILSAIFLGALSSAQRLAQVTNTKSLIQKLHNAMMSRWDAYRSVRLPINAEGRGNNNTADAANERASRFRQDVARRKMLATRELLRMEMPDRYEDLTFTPVYLVTPANTPIRPYIWSAYQRKILEAKGVASKTDSDVAKMNNVEFVARISERFQSAECLYMIMTLGTEDSSTSTEHFSGKDIGDVDNDGMYEFIDAWGTPIEFLRWAPGLSSTAAQPLYSYPYPGPANSPGSVFHASQPKDPNNSANVVSHWKVQFENFTNTNALTGTVGTRIIVIDQDDPFNPMRVGPVRDSVPGSWVRSSRWRPGDPGPEHGFILMPLIYSCGPDQHSGLNHCYKHAIITDDDAEDPPYKVKTAPTEDDQENKGGASATVHIKFSDPYALYENANNQAGIYRGSTRGDGRSLDNVINHDLGTK